MKIGVISDLSHTESPAYTSYYYAAKNLHSDIKLVQSKDDLYDVDILLCGNDHHAGHLNIWSDDSFFTLLSISKPLRFLGMLISKIN
jgi:hypothetical protein